MKCVRPDELSDGDVCDCLVYDSKGRHLVKAGTVINHLIKEKLITAGVPHIYIAGGIFSFSSPFESETCSAALNAINCFFESEGKERDLLKRYGTEDIKKISDYSGETAAKIGYAHLFLYYGVLLAGQALKNREKPYDTRDFRNKSNYYSYHPLGAACLSILIGREAGLSERELSELAAGAMLYDCKMKLYPFAGEGRKLTGTETAELAMHTSAGYDFLKNIYGLPAKSALIASQHHERYDGSGYPRGISRESINFFSGIAAVADVYDALVSDRPFRPAYSAEDAKNYIMENSGVLFDPVVCRAFDKCTVRYVPGSVVSLENGEEAVVVRNSAAAPDHPAIKLIEKKGGSVIISVAETDTAAGKGRKIIQTITRGI